MKALGLLVLAACTAGVYIKPSYELLRESQLLPAEEACQLLTDALASGEYSAQRRTADQLTALNSEYQLGQAREHACRRVEKQQKRGAEIEHESDLVVLRTIAWSGGEEEMLRRRAAERLRTLMANENRHEVLAALAAMKPPTSGLAPWYLALGIEELIEDRLRQPEQDALLSKGVDCFARVVDALAALGLATAQGLPSTTERASLQTAETELCAHVAELTSDDRRILVQTLRGRYPGALTTRVHCLASE